MDDIRPRNSGYNNRGSYGQPSLKRPNDPQNNQPPEGNQPQEQPQYDYHLPEAKKSHGGKRKTIFLVIFILLFILSAGAAAYLYFISLSKANNEIDDLKKNNSELVQKVRSLDYDNRDLKKKLELEMKKNESAQTENQEEAPAEADQAVPTEQPAQ